MYDLRVSLGMYLSVYVYAHIQNVGLWLFSYLCVMSDNNLKIRTISFLVRLIAHSIEVQYSSSTIRVYKLKRHRTPGNEEFIGD